ncbi:recombinase family protein [Candidatus Pantoea formicae]|uniref:recombinase family protein n=1 Tax=Candidatus Pantoea formicae TaxID=2608355 RepID=UPI003EDA4834
MGKTEGSLTPIRVAQYLRMSTEHQKYSIENQEIFIKDYAERHGMIIVHTYDDAGKSGVTLSGRYGLKKLLKDVMNNIINIEAVLVYDVSRFGRFPDPEEAAHYSFILKEHNVRIIYCADPIPEEYPEISMLALPVLRYGAASYSKILSEKVYNGAINLVKRGYRQGGQCGYGLRRLLIDGESERKNILLTGQRKYLQTDRVILIPGPKEEVRTVNRIYDLFISKKLYLIEIATLLNSEGVAAEDNNLWTVRKVKEVLSNEKYIGHNVYNRTSFKLQMKRVKNPQSEWVRCCNAFEPVVSVEKFEKAKIEFANRKKVYSDEELIEHMMAKHHDHGRISERILAKTTSGPKVNQIIKRFGGLMNAYKASELPVDRDFNYLEIKNKIQGVKSNVTKDFARELTEINCGAVSLEKDGMIIDDQLRVAFIVSRCHESRDGILSWKVNLASKLNADLIIIFRLNNENSSPVDCYVIPRIDNPSTSLVLKEHNPGWLDFYRYDDLSYLFHLLEKTSVLRNKDEHAKSCDD